MCLTVAKCDKLEFLDDMITRYSCHSLRIITCSKHFPHTDPSCPSGAELRSSYLAVAPELTQSEEWTDVINIASNVCGFDGVIVSEWVL